MTRQISTPSAEPSSPPSVPDVAISPASGLSTTDIRSHRINQLENELTTLRDDMHLVIEEQEAAHEELQSANEEVISSNEELQSINEELETGKEEIESTNEELLTINQELQVRNDQLSEANAFAEAIFGTIREATLMLTADLHVKSANPIFYTLFGLNEAETEGRLIYELANRQWDIPQLRSLLTDVTTRDVPVEGFELSYSFPGTGEKVLLLNARRVVRQQEAILLAIEDITEYRRSQRLIEEREAWFHQIADNAPVLTWVAGSDGRCTFLNSVLLDYIGRSQADALATGWDQMLHPDDRAGYEKRYWLHLASHEPFQTEYRLLRHDGDYHWMLENAQPTFAPDGAFIGFIGSATDVQRQKELNIELDRLVDERTSELTGTNARTNARLEQSGDTIRQMLDGSMASICLLESVRDETGTIVDFVFRGVNQAIEATIQLSPTELLGSRFLDHFPGARNLFFDDYVRVVETGEPLRAERFYGGEGFHSWFDLSAVKNGDGFILTFLDITDRKRAEEQIEKMAEALQAVIDSSPASIGLLKAVRSPDGTIGDFQVVAGNQQFAQLVGQPLNQLFDLRISALAERLWGKQTLANLNGVVETGEPFYTEQMHAGGWLALSVTKQDDGVVVTGLDVTELRQMQQQREELLRQMKQTGETVDQLSMLREQIRTRGELLRMSSHDLRGSLGVIQGAADLLFYADSDQERAQMLDMIQRNVQQTTRLITELLDLSRLEAGQQSVAFAPFDAADLLRKLGENVRPLVERKGLTLELSGEEPMRVEGDSLNVFRMAQNMVLNALKYTERGSIGVRWGVTGSDEWFFDVDDTGPGMEQDTAHRLSQETTAATVDSDAVNTTVDSADLPSVPGGELLLGMAPGEGIGLVIVRQLCQLLRGRLVIDSRPGRGSTFRVLLPRQY